MAKKLLQSVILFFCLLVSVTAFAAGFKTSDMDGNWYTYGIEIDMSMPAVYWIRGFFEVDETGKILAGTYYGPDGSTITLTSGQIGLDTNGVMSGGFAVQENVGTVVHGKMDQSKTLGSAVIAGTDQTLDILSFVKAGGTFTSNDLTGTWYGYQILIDASTGAVFWVNGMYEIGASGSVTGSFTGPDGSTVTVEGGTMSVDSSGIVSGNLSLSNGKELTIVHGIIDQGKTKSFGVTIEADGSMGLAYMIKAGGIFEFKDVAGKQYAYGLIIDPSIPAVFWVYGDVIINSSGNFNALYNAPTGESIDSSGSLSIDNSGVITGTTSFTESTGIVNFKLDINKTYSTGVAVTSNGTMSIWQFIEASRIAIPSLPLLLLD
jgi:hypothetical protein